MSIGLDPVINGGKGTLSMGYAAGVTTVVLSSGDGAKFPSTFSYNLVWWNSTDYANPEDDPNVEIVRVTARSTDTLTITRAQEGTTDVAHNTGGKTYSMILAITKKMIDDIDAHTHGISEANDYTETSIADGEVLRYDGVGWVNNTIAELITDINQLGNVVIASVAANDVLYYNGTNWVNADYTTAGVAESASNSNISSLNSCATLDAGAGLLLDLQTANAGEVVVNNTQEDVDFRVESNTLDDLLFCDAGNSVIGIKTRTPSIYADLTLEGGALCLKETTTPTADANYGKIYTKTNNKIYFQDGGGVEHEIAFV